MIDRVDSRKFNYDEGRKTLENEVVVFTGRGFTVRWELAQFARNCRAKVESTVTSRTTLLIVGEKPGGKLIKAKKMGCKIISCDDFYNILMGKDKENDIKAAGINTSFTTANPRSTKKIIPTINDTTNSIFFSFSLSINLTTPCFS